MLWTLRHKDLIPALCTSGTGKLPGKGRLRIRKRNYLQVVSTWCQRLGCSPDHAEFKRPVGTLNHEAKTQPGSFPADPVECARSKSAFTGDS